MNVDDFFGPSQNDSVLLGRQESTIMINTQALGIEEDFTPPPPALPVLPIAAPPPPEVPVALEDMNVLEGVNFTSFLQNEIQPIDPTLDVDLFYEVS